MPGFSNTVIDYHNKSAQQQAIEILAYVAAAWALTGKPVGLTYSANHDQCDQIRTAYGDHEWRTGVSGANQASVIAGIEKLLLQQKYKHLQSKARGRG